MRIGLFVDVYYPSIGGVTVAVDTLKRSLEKQGHKVFIITMNNEKKNHKYIREDNIIRIPGIPTGIYDYSVRITYPLKAIKMVKNLNLDIIHSHTEFGMGNFAKSMGRKLNIPVVHTFHTLYEDSLDYITKGHFEKLTKNACKLFMKAYLNFGIKEIIVPTKKTQDFLKYKYKIKKPINIIPTGVDIEKFFKENIKERDVKKLREQNKINPNDFVAMWVGRLGYEKRVNILIEGYVDVVKENKTAKLLIVGGGPEEEKLKELVNKYNLNDNVIFIGKIPYEEIPKYYQLASIVVTASHYETQGLTLVEGFGAGKPVVCVVDESFKNVVKDDYNGKYFRSKKEYSSIIKQLIKNPNKLKEMSINAKSTAREYSLDIFAERIELVYERLLKEYSSNNNK